MSIVRAEKKIPAGILAILLGGLGIHKFYLGYTTAGIIQLLLGLCFGIGAIIGIVEGIIYLTKNDEEFYNTYIAGQKPWF
jgi:TM2 domain-containing membrane protein YozV